MSIAKTLKDKLLLIAGFVLIAAASAYVGSRGARHSAEESIEALDVSCNLTAAAQLLAVSDILREQDLKLAQSRLLQMAKQHLSFYDRYKNNSQIPAETHESAAALNRKLSTLSE